MEFQKKFGKIGAILGAALFVLAALLYLLSMSDLAVSSIYALGLGVFFGDFLGYAGNWLYELFFLLGFAPFVAYALFFFKTQKHSPWLAAGCVVVLLQKSLLALTGLFTGLWLYRIIQFLMSIAPILLLGFVAVFSYIRIKGIWSPIVASALAVLAMASECILAVTGAINLIRMPQMTPLLDIANWLSLLSGRFSYIALYAGVVVLAFISLYYPKRKRPEQDAVELPPLDEEEEAAHQA